MDPTNLPSDGMESRDFYRKTMQILAEKRVPFLVGGAHALNRYSGVQRDSKDFDIFLREQDCVHALDLLADAGFKTELTDVRWIGKAFCNGYYVDFIFGSANCIAVVDEQWFEYAVPSEVLHMPVLLVPPEEMIWSKSFVADRDRFDGADIMHILLQCSDKLDWQRLLARFGKEWRVLFLYLTMFGFVYPAQRTRIPQWLMLELISRLETELINLPPSENVCRGPLFSTSQYAIDLEQWGFADGREPYISRRLKKKKEGGQAA